MTLKEIIGALITQVNHYSYDIFFSRPIPINNLHYVIIIV